MAVIKNLIRSKKKFFSVGRLFANSIFWAWGTGLHNAMSEK
jgi:hypothetical protein